MSHGLRAPPFREIYVATLPGTAVASTSSSSTAVGRILILSSKIASYLPVGTINS